MSEILVWDQFARDLAAAHGEEFVRDFCRTLSDEQRAEEEVAFRSQREIAAANERLDNIFCDGIGECHMRVDLTAYYHWIFRYGREIWNDPEFVREYKRDNPDVVVKSHSRKLMVGYR